MLTLEWRKPETGQAKIRAQGDLLSNSSPLISAFIIAKNEADRVGTAIKSVRDWVDEVIVVDSGSVDQTVSICESFGATVVFNDWTGYGPQKVFGENLCRNRWILNIDADEDVSTELRDEILEIFGSGLGKGLSGYRVPILPLYPFQTSGHPWTVSNYPVRLYNRDSGGFSDSTVHDSVHVREGGVAKLRGTLIHRSFRSLTHHLDKINFYTSAQAEDVARSGKYPSALKLILTPRSHSCAPLYSVGSLSTASMGSLSAICTLFNGS